MALALLGRAWGFLAGGSENWEYKFVETAIMDLSFSAVEFNPWVVKLFSAWSRKILFMNLVHLILSRRDHLYIFSIDTFLQKTFTTSPQHCPLKSSSDNVGRSTGATSAISKVTGRRARHARSPCKSADSGQNRCSTVCDQLIVPNQLVR